MKIITIKKPSLPDRFESYEEMLVTANNLNLYLNQEYHKMMDMLNQSRAFISEGANCWIDLNRAWVYMAKYMTLEDYDDFDIGVFQAEHYAIQNSQFLMKISFRDEKLDNEIGIDGFVSRKKWLDLSNFSGYDRKRFEKSLKLLSELCEKFLYQSGYLLMDYNYRQLEFVERYVHDKKTFFATKIFNSDDVGL